MSNIYTDVITKARAEHIRNLAMGCVNSDLPYDQYKVVASLEELYSGYDMVVSKAKYRELIKESK